MRTGLDPEKIRERAVENIYEQWRSSETAKLITIGSELHLQESVLRTPFHNHFRKHLAKDFILYTDASYPKISVEFTDSDYLWASVQVETSPGVRNLWQGQARLVNNGFLTGAWLAGLILLTGLGLWIATTIFVCFSFLWASHWNPLGLPEYLFERTRTGIALLSHGLGPRELDKDALAFGVALLAILLFLLQRFFKHKFKYTIREKWRFRWFLITLGLEPLLIWLTFSFYQWGAGESWWKLYLMSWTGRFFCIPLLVHHFFFESKDPRWIVHKKHYERPMKLFPVALLIPAVFYFGMGWDWLVVVASSQEAPVLMGLKAFAMAFLLGMVLGSRPFALVFGLLVFPMMLGTNTPPLDMAFLLGIFLDGLLVGWVMSPWMMCVEPWRLIIDRRIVLLLVPTTLIIGLMLSSVGIPYVVPWILLIMVVWGFYNLNKGVLAQEG